MSTISAPNSIKIHFWGTRGSSPVSLNQNDIRSKITDALTQAKDKKFQSTQEIHTWIETTLPFSTKSTYGGNTSCIQIEAENNEYLLCDAGTGLRVFGNSVSTSPAMYHLFLSHLHWDHIQGFPFFTPAYSPNNSIIIHSCHTDVEQIFNQQMSSPGFPINFNSLQAKIQFKIHSPKETVSCAGYTISAFKQNHPGDSYAFKFEKNGKTLVYATDCEFTQEDIEQENNPFFSFCKNADLLVLDAQYSSKEAVNKKDWGHNSTTNAINIAQKSAAHHLVLFHLEPESTDKQLDDFLKNSAQFHTSLLEQSPPKQQFPKNLSLAYDELEIII